MKNVTRRLALSGALAAAAVLGGCQMNMTTYEGADAGYLVASLAIDPGSSYSNIQFDFRSRDGKVDDYLFWVNDDAVLAPAADFHEGGAKGSIATVRLKPGQYEFHSFGVKAPGLGYEPRFTYSIQFTIESGKATYLGQFLALGIPKKGYFGGEVDGAPYFVVSNQQARDLGLAKKKTAEVASFGVISAVPDPAKIRVPYFQSAPLTKGATVDGR